MSEALSWEPDAILVVDDQALMRDLVSAICAQLGYKHVHAVEDGEKALERMRQINYTLVICDWQMKPISGLDLLRMVRADESLKHTKFMMMTTHSNVDAALASKRAGVDGYILKPFTSKALADTISALL